jgi:uncharacterized protein YciI
MTRQEVTQVFVVFLRFSDRRSEASRLMEAHDASIRRGFDDGVFITVGWLRPEDGGAILAHGTTRDELGRRVDADPFASEGVVRAEIHEIAPARTDPRLDFLTAA